MKVLVGLLVFVVGVAAAGIWYGNFYDGNLLGAMQSVEYMYKKNFAEISHDQKPTKSRNNSNNSSSSIIMQYRKILPLIRSIENNEGLHPGIENCELIYENHDVGSQIANYAKLLESYDTEKSEQEFHDNIKIYWNKFVGKFGDHGAVKIACIASMINSIQEYAIFQNSLRNGTRYQGCTDDELCVDVALIDKELNSQTQVGLRRFDGKPDLGAGREFNGTCVTDVGKYDNGKGDDDCAELDGEINYSNIGPNTNTGNRILLMELVAVALYTRQP